MIDWTYQVLVLGRLQKVGLACSWLGIQDASRKFQPPSQAPGPWDCTVTNTEGGAHWLVSQDRWDKTRRLISELVGM